VIDDNPPSQKRNGWHCCDLQLQGPRSRAVYYSRNSLLHTWITYYTELPMKVPITHHHLENRYYTPPPIAITGNRLTLERVGVSIALLRKWICYPLSLDQSSPARILSVASESHLHSFRIMDPATGFLTKSVTLAGIILTSNVHLEIPKCRFVF